MLCSDMRLSGFAPDELRTEVMLLRPRELPRATAYGVGKVVGGHFALRQGCLAAIPAEIFIRYSCSRQIAVVAEHYCWPRSARQCSVKDDRVMFMLRGKTQLVFSVVILSFSFLTGITPEAKAQTGLIGGWVQQPLATDIQGNYVAVVTIVNNGNVTIQNLEIEFATLGAESSISAPLAIPGLAPGANAAVTLEFPPASVPGRFLQVSGTYALTDAAVNGNWVLSFRVSRINLFSIDNQEPISEQQYQGSIFTTPLPANAENHCLGDVPCTASSPDKAVINCIFGGNCTLGTGGNETNAGFQRIAYDPAHASGGGTGASGTYYCDSSCPIYKIVSLANQVIPSTNNPLNQYFHLPNQAFYGNAVGGDNYLFVWDQSTDGSAGNTVPGGRRFTDYEFSPVGQKTLPPCMCTTENCADVTASCQLSMNYADYSYPLNDSSAIGEGEAYVSVGAASQVGLIRGNELAAGVINHAIWLNTSCEASGAVFPSLGGQALTCNNQTNRPHAGALFKISSSFNCSTVTPQELKAVCVALQTYGGYLSDTSGPASGGSNGLWPSRIEGGVAYWTAGIAMPGLQQLNNHANGTTLQCNSEQINATPAFCSVQFFNLSGLITGNNLEMIDPCIPLSMAGEAGGCSQ